MCGRQSHAPSFPRAAPGLPSSWRRWSQPSYGNPAGAQSQGQQWEAQGPASLIGHVSKFLKLPGPQFPPLLSGNKNSMPVLKGVVWELEQIRNWDPLGTRALRGRHS